jgi:hypothetical protein
MNTEGILLVSRRDAARLLGISLRSLDGLVSNGQLEVRRIGRRVMIETRILNQFARRDHPTQLVSKARAN